MNNIYNKKSVMWIKIYEEKEGALYKSIKLNKTIRSTLSYILPQKKNSKLYIGACCLYKSLSSPQY